MSAFAAVTPHENNTVHFVMVGNPSAAAFESEFVYPLEALLANETRFSVVVDATNVTGVSMTVAWRMIKWMRANKPKLATYLRGSGVVIVNPTVKSIMEFVLSVQPAAAPMHITTTVADAWSFIRTLI